MRLWGLAYAGLIFTSFITFLPTQAQAQVKESCACEQSSCGPCQKAVVVGTKVKFCDWGDINVCRDVVCENVPYYFSCLSNLEDKKKEEEAAKETKLLSFDYEEDRQKALKDKKLTANRAVASVGDQSKSPKRPRTLITSGRKEIPYDAQVEVTPIPVQVGQIDQVSQALEIVHRGQRAKLKKGHKLSIGDEILNTSQNKQGIVFVFPEGRVRLQVHSKSRLIIEDPMSILGRFQPFAYLVHGGVDIKVELKKGHFDLLAGQILTRIPPGEAQVSYQMEERGLTVRVESLTAQVQVLRARDLSGATVPVEPGQFISWISETPRSMFSLDEKLALAHEGFLSPVFLMTPQRKKELGILPLQEAPLFADWNEKQSPTQGKAEALAGGRQLASRGDQFCQAPAGKFQQCAWTCEGNPKGASSCLATQEKVHCVRRECNAAGQWGLPTPFASSYGDLCPAQGVRVGSCSPSGD